MVSQALPLRAEPARLRAHGGERADAGRAQGKARRAAYPAELAEDLLRVARPGLLAARELAFDGGKHLPSELGRRRPPVRDRVRRPARGLDRPLAGAPSEQTPDRPEATGVRLQARPVGVDLPLAAVRTRRSRLRPKAAHRRLRAA